jgi:two-component system sensor histidine kinase HydH
MMDNRLGAQSHEGILRGMTSGLLAVDLEGRITFLNTAAERILGWQRSKVMGLSVDTLTDGNGEFCSVMAEILQEGVPFCQREASLVREDGQSFPAAVVASALRDEGRELVGAVVMFVELGEAGAEREASRSANGSAAMPEMAAVIAHVTRNRLAGIAAGVEYLASKFSSDEPPHKAAVSILGAVAELNGFVEDILLASRPLELHLAPCAVADVLDGALSRWEEQAAAQGVVVRTSIASDVPPVRADPLLLGRVLSDVLSNAIEAMPGGGCLEVSVTRRQAGSGGRGGGPGGGGDWVVVEVKDTGPGISSPVLGRVFDPFFTTKPRGTGLGLAIAARIIAHHGGEITVRNQEGPGTVFCVSLPGLDCSGRKLGGS